MESPLHSSEAALRAEIEILRRRLFELELAGEGIPAGEDPAEPGRGKLAAVEEALLDCMSEGVAFQRLVRDGSGRGADLLVLWVNRAFETLLGTRRESLLGRRASGFSPGDVERLVPVYERLCDTGEPVTFEHRGSLTGRRFRVSAFRRSADEFISVYVDVTDEREMLAALQRSEERYRTLLDSISDAVYLLDRDWRYLMVNEKAARDVQIPRERLIGGILFDLFPGLEETAFFRTMKAVMDGRQPDSMESPYEHPDGRLGHYELRVYPVPDGILCISTDVTARKRMEADLRHAEKMKAVGQLAGGIAHDFNNQLVGITGFAEMVRHAADVDPALKTYAEGILKAARRASELTSQLLAFSRKGKNLTQRCDVSDLVEEVVELLGRSIDKRISIRTELAGDRPCAEGDPTQIQNAILNLALNARDAMPEGGTLTFRTESVELGGGDCFRGSFELSPGPYLRISVLDTGAGLDEVTRERIFEPFFTTKPEGQGTGMGLAAVYGTATSHHGAIECESLPGQGTAFHLLLPDVGRGEPRPVPVPGERAPGDAAGRRILVVDDEDIVRDMIQAMLARSGYEVVAVSGGREALEALRDAPETIDLVILDMIMPGLGGGETFRSLREARPGIPVVLCSGFGLNGEAQAMLDEGVRAFLTKPYTMNELLDCVESILGAR